MMSASRDEIGFRAVVRAQRADAENRGKPAKDCLHCRDGDPCRTMPFCRLRVIALAGRAVAAAQHPPRRLRRVLEAVAYRHAAEPVREGDAEGA